MLALLGEFTPRFKIKKCLIDNTTFRLHYHYTFVILCISSFLQTLNQFFGDNIDCDVGDGVEKSVFDVYCWIHGTFTLPSYLVGKRGHDFPHPGVGPYPSSEDSGLIRVTDQGDEIRHAWYQWVVFVLFFQVINC